MTTVKRIHPWVYRNRVLVEGIRRGKRKLSERDCEEIIRGWWDRGLFKGRDISLEEALAGIKFKKQDKNCPQGQS